MKKMKKLSLNEGNKVLDEINFILKVRQDSTFLFIDVYFAVCKKYVHL